MPPTRSQIVFESGEGSGDNGWPVSRFFIHIMDTDGRNLRQLAAEVSGAYAGVGLAIGRFGPEKPKNQLLSFISNFVSRYAIAHGIYLIKT